MKIKGYITNLGKYNEGEQIGEWITLPIGKKDLQDTLERIGCNYYTEDENGEITHHITGYGICVFIDGDIDFDIDLDRFENIDDVNKLAEQIKRWDKNTFIAAVEVFGIENIDLDKPNDYILHSDIKCDYSLGYYYAVKCGNVDFKDDPVLEQYFNYEAYGFDINYDADGGYSTRGWIEHIS